MALAFTIFVCGWLAAGATFQFFDHHYGYGLFNAAFAVVAGLIAWREA